MGIVAVIALLVLIAAGFADLALMFKTMRRGRTRAAAPRPVRAIDPQTQARLTELAGQGNKIQAIEERARELIAQGRKIQAIKLIREETGLGLKEAKDAADGLSEFQAGSIPGELTGMTTSAATAPVLLEY